MVGGTVEGIRADVRKRFPQLQNVDFSIRYFDREFNEYLDFDDDMLPPSGAAIRVGFEVLAPETEVDSDATDFPLSAVPESSSFNA